MPGRSDLRLAAIGLIAGGTSGLLGVGGGVVLVPGLVLVARFSQRRAHATSLAAILPIGAVGAAIYIARGEVHYVVAGALAAGSVLGAPVGVRALERVPEHALRLVFVAVLVLSAVRLLSEGSAATLPPHPIAWSDAVVGFVIGIAAGAFAGLLGVGGGIVMVPAITVLLEQGQHVAQGTSLLVIIATAIAATGAARKRGLVDVRAAGVLGLSGIFAAVGGSAIAGLIADAILRRMFGVFMILIAARLVLQRRASRAGEPSGGGPPVP